MSGALNGGGQHPLMKSAIAGYSPGDNLSPFIYKPLQETFIQIIDSLYLFFTETTDTFPPPLKIRRTFSFPVKFSFDRHFLIYPQPFINRTSGISYPRFIGCLIRNLHFLVVPFGNSRRGIGIRFRQYLGCLFRFRSGNDSL